MRFSRWLILAALLAIVAFVGQTYIKRQQTLARDAPPAPPRLETGINGRASDWVYTQSDGERPRVTIRAKSFRQVKAPSVMELEGVELQLFHKEGSQFDLVRSAKAQFDIAAKNLYSDGDVDIIMPTASKKDDRTRCSRWFARRQDSYFRSPFRQRHRQSVHRPRGQVRFRARIWIRHGCRLRSQLTRIAPAQQG